MPRSPTLGHPFGHRPGSVTLRGVLTHCPGQGSNLHGVYTPGDFKSPASAIPPPGLTPLSIAPLSPCPLRSLVARRRPHRGRRLHGLAHAAHVVLVFDVADQLLDDVLERDEPNRLPRKVHHNGHLTANLSEFL